ncbi:MULTISPECIES: GAF domain-containing protein [Trichocoleus]|uniref:histidine kinase n=1 Tax=Trichocoleus desertorum GB2-A4 TaxID=2933944 RepID=A0ABV0JBT2_9CYAN|nr:GAF domain-containing protein [Trichocoleus sp. FACHB-46]MBD1861424.1 GAF domain-containing protein [Trichocoleus sp. FACHB-46]
MKQPESSFREEIEPSLLAQGTLLNRMTNRIRQSLELPEILAATVAETRSFLGTDRVKVYRFHPDESGEVIAESIYQQRLPSLLGLNFPADDIPPQAREMFVKARQRVIVDVLSQQVNVSWLNSPDTAEDLAAIGLLQRPVDPCHVEYLTAMGVQSSLVVPILHHQQLWGLLVSHHSEPRVFSATDLQILQMVADQVSIAIAQSNLLTQAREQAAREAIVNQISTLLHAPLSIQAILQIVLQRVIEAVQGSGGRLFLAGTEATAGGHLYAYGTQPQLPDAAQPLDLEASSFWQELMDGQTKPVQPALLLSLLQRSPLTKSAIAASLTPDLMEITEEAQPVVYPAIPHICAIADLYQEPKLAALQTAFATSRIRSILIMPLRYGQQSLGCLSIFRDEVDTEKAWAGHWDSDERQQRPRQSFEVWRELKQAQAQPWLEGETELIRALGTHLSMAVMQNRLYQYEREQRLLVEMRNQELHTARTVAEEASRLKSDFLSSTSHELRTPLASTLNYLKLLKEGFYDNEEELKEYIQVAYQSAENLVDIINDVLDIAKIEAGRMNINLEVVHLPTLLQEEQNLFNLDSRRKGIALIVECEVDNVYADKIKLRQILTNLVSNALKFTSQGEIHIHAVKKTDNSSQSKIGQIVEVSVTDTGIGIDLEKRDLLFEPFVQADGSIKRRYGGTGLGLTISKRLVELMGGRIWIDSAGKDQGTQVSFTLPHMDTLNP